jgi:Flp pilus assembly pilin Flp
MNDLLLRAYIAVQSLVEREEGQDLVEYSLVIALIAFGGITGMKTLSTGLNHAFSQISVTVTTKVRLFDGVRIKDRRSTHPSQTFKLQMNAMPCRFANAGGASCISAFRDRRALLAGID